MVMDSGSQEGKVKPQSRLLACANGVAVLSLHGCLTSQDNWYNEYAGLVSYNEIRQAALEALANPDVSEILLDVASPGGSVAGMQDAADTLKLVGRSKRITAYSDSVAASAAYLQFSVAKDRFASSVADIGSIGVLRPHMEYSEQLKTDGVGAKIFRSGKFKALGHPIESLSDTAEEEIQAQVDYLGAVFTQAVADNLGVSYAAVDTKMGQGREFIGEQAVAVGLIDAVSSFDKVYAAMVSRVAKKKGGEGMPKYTNRAGVDAAIAAGIPVSPEELAAVPAEPGTELTDEQIAEAATAAVVTDSTEATAPVVVVDESAVVALLKAQLSDANGAAVKAQVDLKLAQDALALAQSAMAPLQAIVATGVNTMLVALGQSADEALLAAAPAALLERHTATATLFTKSFPVGGVTVPGTEAEAVTAAPESAMDTARRQATIIPLPH
jgi:signal peptide peptidase SppA